MSSKPSLNIRQSRIPRELAQLSKSETIHGLKCVPKEEDNYNILIATIAGPKDSPYNGNTYQLSITVSERYPFQVPIFEFITPIYHPNIDNNGKICLDILKMPPTGTYNPALTLESILLTIQLLLAYPNPDDALRADVAEEFKHNRELFEQKARSGKLETKLIPEENANKTIKKRKFSKI